MFRHEIESADGRSKVIITRPNGTHYHGQLWIRDGDQWRWTPTKVALKDLGKVINWARRILAAAREFAGHSDLPELVADTVSSMAMYIHSLLESDHTAQSKARKTERWKSLIDAPAFAICKGDELIRETVSKPEKGELIL